MSNELLPLGSRQLQKSLCTAWVSTRDVADALMNAVEEWARCSELLDFLRIREVVRELARPGRSFPMRSMRTSCSRGY